MVNEEKDRALVEVMAAMRALPLSINDDDLSKWNNRVDKARRRAKAAGATQAEIDTAEEIGRR